MFDISPKAICLRGNYPMSFGHPPLARGGTSISVFGGSCQIKYIVPFYFYEADAVAVAGFSSFMRKTGRIDLRVSTSI